MTEDLNWTSLLPAYFLLATLLLATCVDILSRRIPNRLLIPALAVALILGAATAGLAGVVMAASGLGVGLALLLPFYALGAMGAGDVKLLGVAGAFLGPHGALVAGLMTFVAGALLGTGWLIWQYIRPGIQIWLTELKSTTSQGPMAQPIASAQKRTAGVPYAPAIAAGAAFALWEKGWLLQTITS